jgi:hypothetical protein
MKRHVPAMVLLLAASVMALPALAAPPEPPFPRAPSGFSLRSIDEQALPPAMKEDILARARLLREHKVISISDDRLPDFAGLEAEHRTRGRALDQVIANKTLAFSPADITATSLQGKAVAEALPHGVYTNGAWTGVSRVFHHPDLRYVVLEETNLAVAGGGVAFSREMINADVNSAPATLMRRQGADRSETSLSWYAGGVLYLLRTPPIDDKAGAALLDIARHIKP